MAISATVIRQDDNAYIRKVDLENHLLKKLHARQAAEPFEATLDGLKGNLTEQEVLQNLLEELVQLGY